MWEILGSCGMKGLARIFEVSVCEFVEYLGANASSKKSEIKN